MRIRTVALTIFAVAAALPPGADGQEAPTRTLFTNVMVWDGTAESRVSADVLVEDNMIAGVGSGLSRSGATVVDGGGRTLMPGLIDMHTHIMFPRGLPDHENVWDAAASGAMAHENMAIYVSNGFTTLRDMCGSPSLSRAIASGALTGPRMYSSGACISSYAAHADWAPQTAVLGQVSNHTRAGNSLVANSPAEYREAARFNFRQGAQFLKIFVGGGVASAYDPLEAITIRPEELRAAVEVAEDFGSYVCIHVYHAEHIQMALDQGVRCIEHGFLMDEATMDRMVAEDIALSAQAFMSYTAFQDPAGIPGFGPEQIAKGLQGRRDVRGQRHVHLRHPARRDPERDAARAVVLTRRSAPGLYLDGWEVAGDDRSEEPLQGRSDRGHPGGRVCRPDPRAGRSDAEHGGAR
jgi:imidazolonepropionase-like amidohydrolase